MEEHLFIKIDDTSLNGDWPIGAAMVVWIIANQILKPMPTAGFIDEYPAPELEVPDVVCKFMLPHPVPGTEARNERLRSLDLTFKRVVT